MGKSDLPNISSVECCNVLDSIQNEFDQLQKEDSALSKLHEELSDLVSQRAILSKRKGFNDKYCLLCCSTFNLLFKRKLPCQDCQFQVCRTCANWTEGGWMCLLCEKQKDFNALCSEWLNDRLKASFGSFSSVKTLQDFWRMRRVSDSENDSGYGAVGESPLMKLLSSHSLNKDMKVNDCSSSVEGGDEEEEEECEDELSEIHYSIETILEGLLGGTLDDAPVQQLYPQSNTYVELFTTYHIKLVEVIQNLSRALQKALHNLPCENGVTPTSAHAALKSVLSSLVEDCQAMPQLECVDKEVGVASPFEFGDIFSSYDSLVATAVINKVVEECQSKYKGRVCLPLEQAADDVDNPFNPVDARAIQKHSSFNLPVECVQIEEVEEITQEYADSDSDDKLSSISKWSNDTPVDPFGLDPSPSPFPDINLMDDPEMCADLSRSASVASWEENWLFRKKQRLPLYSNLQYQLMTYCDRPPCMLIPCPSSTDISQQDQEECSDLSETLSTGSLEISSGGDDSLPFIEPQANSSPQTQVPCADKVSTLSISTTIIETEVPKQPAQKPVPTKTIEVKSKDLHSTQILKERHKAEESDVSSTPPKPGTIAEREHQKWLTAAPLQNNPYSTENIYRRTKKPNILEDQVASFQEFERKLSVSSSEDPKVNCGPKSIDSQLYGRDYYVNENSSRWYPLQKSVKNPNDHCFESLPDEALNSHEEKVYVRDGRVFTLEDRIRLLEQETPNAKQVSEEPDGNVKRLLPSSKGIVTKFYPESARVFPPTSSTTNTPEPEKQRKSKPCRKVHSLTARSLSREFRDLAKMNLPKPMNRTVSASPDQQIQDEPVHQDKNSEEKNDSKSGEDDNSAPVRRISRSILERATYWERRAERGLLSDASVREDFPGITD